MPAILSYAFAMYPPTHIPQRSTLDQHVSKVGFVRALVGIVTGVTVARHCVCRHSCGNHRSLIQRELHGCGLHIVLEMMLAGGARNWADVFSL